MIQIIWPLKADSLFPSRYIFSRRSSQIATNSREGPDPPRTELKSDAGHILKIEEIIVDHTKPLDARLSFFIWLELDYI
jgi:hypothetical protein